MSLSLGPENSSLMFNLELRRDSFSSEILELTEVSTKWLSLTFYFSSTIFFIFIGIYLILSSMNTLILNNPFLKAILSLIFLATTL